MTTMEVYAFVAPAIVTGFCWIVVWWQLKH